MKPICSLDHINQVPALFHLLQWLNHEAVAASLTMLRGQISDSNYTRRALEICALFVHIARDKENGKRWLEAGLSKSACARHVVLRNVATARTVRKNTSPKLQSQTSGEGPSSIVLQNERLAKDLVGMVYLSR